MATRATWQGTLCRVFIEDDMTIYTAAAQKSELVAILEKADTMEANLGGVTEIDSAGLQLLLLLKREGASRGKEVRLTGHSAPVLRLLDLYRLGSFFGDPLVIPSDGRI